MKNRNIHLIGDAFFAFPPSFAQGASQSIESAYELFESIENDAKANFKKRVTKKKWSIIDQNLISLYFTYLIL